MLRQWKSSFCSLDPQVDEDHRTLFQLLDRLATHRRESDLEALNLLLDQLLDHTFVHFAREEVAMQTSDYPNLAQHAEQHQVIQNSLIDALKRVARDEWNLPVFIQHLKESFTYHFEMDDLTFVSWKQQQARASKAATRTMASQAAFREIAPHTDVAGGHSTWRK